MKTLIKNGLVYDGSGNSPIKQDILIRGSQIVGLGNFNKNSADLVLDANNAIITPGFIDVSGSLDHYLKIPGFTHAALIRQGITTIIGGNCGSSLVPLINGHDALDSIKKWGISVKLNINWDSVKDFLKIIQKNGIGINFGTLIGHSTIRRAITGEALRDLTKNELDIFKKILSRSFKEGAFGLSFGLEYIHSQDTPFSEILELVKLTKSAKKIYATHLRNTENKVLEAVEEILSISGKTGANTQINHFSPDKNYQDEFKKAKELIEKESAKIHINFDCAPFEYTPLPIYKLLPEWMQVDNLKIMEEFLLTKHLKTRLVAHLKKFDEKDIIIGFVSESFKMLIGKSLKAFMENTGLKNYEAIFKLMKMTNLKATVFYKNINGELLEKFINSPSSFISSGGFGFPAPHLEKEDFQLFKKFISYIQNYSNMPLEKAITKLTSIPAEKYEINKRGFIKENYYADILVLRENEPENVFVNGESILKDKILTKALPGMALKHSGF